MRWVLKNLLPLQCILGELIYGFKFLEIKLLLIVENFRKKIIAYYRRFLGRNYCLL